MSLRRQLFFALGAPTVLMACMSHVSSQEPAKLSSAEDRPAFLRNGARKTEIVKAVQRVKAAVVNIHSERTLAPSPGDLFPAPNPNRVNGMGTGIVIDPRGYIVTNHHVVDDVTLLRVRLADGTSRHATIIARAAEKDLALIKIDPPRPLQTMPLGTADDLMEGEPVIAIGNAFGYEHTVSVGIVSAIKRDVTLNKDMSYKALIQTDASINPGNSGGPLVNIHGELVGVNVAIRANAQGIGFAIQVDDMIKTVAAMLRSRRNPSQYDGMTVRDQIDVKADALSRRVVVEHIESGSPAEAAGIKVGDELTKLGNTPVLCSFDIDRALIDRPTGDSLPIVFRRRNEEKKSELALAPLNGDRAIPAAATNLDVVWSKLGLQLAPAASDSVTRANSQLNGGLEVTNILSGSAAAKAGIKKGDILVGLHQWETTKLDDVHYVLNLPELATYNPLSFYILRGGQIRQGKLPPIP